MQVRIIDFPKTKVAVLEHRGPPQLEYETVRRLVQWRQQNGLRPDGHRSYGVHYTDPRTVAPQEHRVDFCISVDQDVPANPQGVATKFIPSGRCTVARHLGSRQHNSAAVYLYEVWFPASGEQLRDFPIFFHYVNVGPHVKDHEMVTDVYLPLERRST